MKITHNNYEAYFLDWVEGRLDKPTQQELETFLLENPELKNELEAYEEVTLAPTKTIFENKNTLYRHEFEKTQITATNYSDFCIALYENILSEKKRKELLDYSTQSASLKSELTNFRKVYLEANENIKYSDKNLLYKTAAPKLAKKKQLYPIWLSVAAGLAIFVVVFYPRQKNITSISPSVAVRSKTNFPAKVEESKVSENIAQPKIQANNNAIFVKAIAQTPKLKTEPRENGIEVIKPLEVNISMTKPEPDLQTAIALREDYPATYYSEPTIPESDEDLIEVQKNTLLAIAESGINKLGKITGSNLELSHQTDENGKINNFSFKTGFVEFSRKRSR